MDGAPTATGVIVDDGAAIADALAARSCAEGLAAEAAGDGRGTLQGVGYACADPGAKGGA